MHTIEPFYNWGHIYVSEEDELSPFYKREYSEFAYTQAIYNYYIHPQWDDFGSRTLYVKVLMADYEEKYAVIEMIGEWNDALENDIMTLKREVLEVFMAAGIYKFILICENVLNFHNGDRDYYEELLEELNDESGWALIINMPASTQYDFIGKKLDRYITLLEIENWRAYKPYHLFKKVKKEMSHLLP